MSWLRVIIARARGLFLKSRLESELDEELRAHIEMLAAENVRRGLSPPEARHQAVLAFGGVEQVKETYRDRRSLPLIETLVQDVHYGVRSLRKNPIYALVAALVLALGIGANTAIFSFADLALTRPVALPRLARLVAIVERTPPEDDDEPLSPANYLDLKTDTRSLEDLAAYRSWSASITGQNEPAQIEGVRVTGNFFPMLGVEPALGRVFLPEEQEPGKDRVLVLSDGFWRRRFGADPAILGQTLRLDEQSYTVVGVMPLTFNFPLGGQNFWTPLAMDSAEKIVRGEQSFRTFGRLRAELGLEQARAEIETKWSRLQKQFPESNEGHRVTVVDLRRSIVRSDERQFVLFLIGVVSFVLLIACANVANLQLARAAGRHREISLRIALGAGRWRIARQLLTESMVLSTAGAALGLLLAVWGVSVLGATMPAEVSAMCDLNSLKVDARALAFTFCLALLPGLLSGIAPAWQNSRSELNDALKEGGGRTTSGHGNRMRKVFVVAEVALALILLIGASRW